MKIEDLIKQTAQLRDTVQAAIAESETDVPHLINAAGSLGLALRNLEGHVAAAAAAVEAAKKAEAAKN